MTTRSRGRTILGYSDGLRILFGYSDGWLATILRSETLCKIGVLIFSWTSAALTIAVLLLILSCGRRFV